MSDAAGSPFLRVHRHTRNERRAGALAGLPGALVAAASLAAWWLIEPRTPDLAAQVYRADLYDQSGFTLWDNNWYAGHHVPGYSLLFGPLAHLVGLRLLGVLAVLASTVLFAAIMREHFPAASRWATAWFSVGASADIWIGRLTFSLGVALGLAALLSATRERRLLAGGLAALCAAASPVAGLFVVLAALAEALGTARPLRALSLGAPALAVASVMSLLFPEGGRQPFALTSVLATVAAALAFLVLLPARERVLRMGAVLYLAAVGLTLVVSSPMGSNVARLGVLFAGPLLLATHLAMRQRLQRGFALRRTALVVGGSALLVWAVWGPVRESLKVAHDPSVSAAYYTRVGTFLRARLTTPARVEVPFTRGHWETVMLGDRLALARGWERQLDTLYDRLFFDGLLTAARYQDWLQANAVRFVALPDAPPDVSSRREVQLLRAGLPNLRPVFGDRHWQVFAVTGASTLVRGPGTLTALPRDGFSVQALARGQLVVRIHYTRYWQLVRGTGCLAPAAGGWTTLIPARAPETLQVRARFSLAAALGRERTCSLP